MSGVRVSECEKGVKAVRASGRTSEGGGGRPRGRWAGSRKTADTKAAKGAEREGKGERER